MFATGNADKAREVSEIFAAAIDDTVVAAPIEAGTGTVVGFLVARPAELEPALAAIRRPDEPPDVTEDGATLLDNARIKALGVARALGAAAVADDTGLEVDALGGGPGVHTARYAGPTATAADNRARLLAEVGAARRAARTARFVTVALWCDPTTGAEHFERGVAEGVIVDSERGEGGFGYDPVFAPVGGGGRTFAEMTAAEKHAISHRGRAFRALAAALAGPTQE